MFTGIVAAVGRVRAVEAGARAACGCVIDAGGLDLKDVAIGDSIAVNGVCLTVVARKARSFEADVSRGDAGLHRRVSPPAAASTWKRRCASRTASAAIW